MNLREASATRGEEGVVEDTQGAYATRGGGTVCPGGTYRQPWAL